MAATGSRRTIAASAIEFTLVPPEAPGGAEQLTAIEGRATEARPGQRIVLYARSGDWYVQPYANAPFTVIEGDGTWRSPTHLGTEYAALLVDAEYRPLAKTPALPGIGGGVVVVAVTDGVPPWWRTRAFRLAGLAVAVLLGFALHRFRLQKLARELDARSLERLTERTRIAQELYDTLLQGFLSASMQLHLAVDQLPEGTPDRARLDQALSVMGRATDEGRRVLHGLRCGNSDAERLESTLARLPGELPAEAVGDYKVTVVGESRRLHPIIRDEVYRVGREAVVNAFRHARARAVAVEVEYSPKGLRVAVRDDGCGIDPQVLASAREGDCGLPGMRKGAAGIAARLRIRSDAGKGTLVELSVPGNIAFQGPADGPRTRETGA
ncbi:MAG TPA: sensor histidine kinase [Vicinamibacteria bacterium]|nr:sensor histidine kinase [Vicinamibacteria bacterium]